MRHDIKASSVDMLIRPATKEDFVSLYKLGLETPEFKVSEGSSFMDEDEFLSAIENPNGTFLMAEDGGAVAGFIYASRQDFERAPVTKWACLVYVVVSPNKRKHGIAQALYAACIQDLKTHGITKVYGWASVEGDGSIISFLKKNGFAEGHKYVWMDREI